MTEKKLNTRKQWLMFYQLWLDKPHTCEVCRNYLGEELNSCHFDHLLEKSKYPELQFCTQNIMIVCKDCHHEKSMGNPYPDHNARISDFKAQYERFRSQVIKHTEEYKKLLDDVYEHAVANTTFFD